MQPCERIEELTTGEAAALCGLSSSRIRDLAACGVLHARRHGRTYLIRRDSIIRYARYRAASKPRPKLRLVVNNN